MNRPYRASPLPTLARLMRSDAMRWLALVLLAPLLALGTLGGSRFLAHGHDEHGTHVHPVGLHDGGTLAVADHADDHGHDHKALPSDDPADENQGGDEQGEVPEGVIVSLDVHNQMPSRGIDLGRTLSPASLFVVAVFALPPWPDLDRHIGSPGGSPGGGPMDLIALSTSDRLVRTSRALLI